MGYAIAIVVRLLWSLTIGLPFFLVGLVLFLLLDIFFPNKATGYKVLTTLYQWGSCFWFKGIKLRKRPGEIVVDRVRGLYVFLENGFTGREDAAKKEDKPVVATWEDNYMGRILKSSRLPGRWVDDEYRRMLQEDWQALVKNKLMAMGISLEKPGQQISSAEFEQREQKCIDRIIAWQRNE